MKKAIELTEQADTKGIQVQIAGRIDGKEIARVEWIREGTKFQKVPVHKMVRTDSSDPAGRLHAYLQVDPCSQGEKNSSLTSVR
ncbi:hypothetical protein U1Q18_036916 [Sarracenia purpurea var. burkii]